MNLNPDQLPYQTRVEFSPQRGRNVLIFADKQIPLNIAYPLPDAFNLNDETNYERGINDVLHLIYIENRNAVLTNYAQQNGLISGNKKPPIEGALVDSPEPDPAG